MNVCNVQSMVSFLEVKKAGASSTPKNQIQTETPSSKESDAFEFSGKALDLLKRRSISDLEKQQYKMILTRAAEPGVSADPKAFLKTLSKSEMDLLRRAQSLADPIEINTLAAEGAANLLVEPGAARDLDNNGLTMVGKGNSIAFPSNNAPESFKAAWAKATEGMDPLDIPMHLPFMIGLANIHIDQNGTVTSYEPTDPEWKNPFADSEFDYSKAIQNIVAGIEYSHATGRMSEEQFQKDMGFYKSLR
jgi:hypothetical protein